MLKLNNPQAEIYIPTTSPEPAELAKTTHLGIGAHQDDLEILAIHGILAAYDDPAAHFTGVTVTDGRGAPRSGPSKGMSDDALWQARIQEQKQAAEIGHYYAQFLLNYPSRVVKSPDRRAVIDDLKHVLLATQPNVVYTHNLADKHDTHVAVSLAVVQACRELAPDERPQHIFGCEVWRGLDWLPAKDKIALDVSRHPALQEALLNVFQSQVQGGKDYVQASLGRRRANATYLESHAADDAALVVYAMALTPLLQQPGLSPGDYVAQILNNLATDVANRIHRLG